MFTLDNKDRDGMFSNTIDNHDHQGSRLHSSATELDDRTDDSDYD